MGFKEIPQGRQKQDKNKKGEKNLSTVGTK